MASSSGAALPHCAACGAGWPGAADDRPDGEEHRPNHCTVSAGSRAGASGAAARGHGTTDAPLMLM